HSAEALQNDIARRSVSRDHFRDERLALAESGDAAALQEGLGTAGVELDELVDDRGEARRHDHPADAPAGHGPGLGEAVDDDERAIGRRPLEERRRGRYAAIDDARIALVGHDP